MERVSQRARESISSSRWDFKSVNVLLSRLNKYLKVLDGNKYDWEKYYSRWQSREFTRFVCWRGSTSVKEKNIRENPNFRFSENSIQTFEPAELVWAPEARPQSITEILCSKIPIQTENQFHLWMTFQFLPNYIYTSFLVTIVPWSCEKIVDLWEIRKRRRRLNREWIKKNWKKNSFNRFFPMLHLKLTWKERVRTLIRARKRGRKRGKNCFLIVQHVFAKQQTWHGATNCAPKTERVTTVKEDESREKLIGEKRKLKGFIAVTLAIAIVAISQWHELWFFFFKFQIKFDIA